MPTLIAVDANFIIGFCAKEPDKHAITRTELAKFARDGAQVFAPGVIVSESLFAFCRKLERGDINAAQYAAAVTSLYTIMRAIDPPPNGEASLVTRADQIRNGRTCKRTTDAIYIALAEELARLGDAELVTFDQGIRSQALAEAPTVMVRLLTPASPTGGTTPPPPPANS